MKKGEYIFVYGTLRRGERADLNAASNHFGVEFVGEDHINGEIYNLGSYPGAKVTPGNFDSSLPAITGDVFRIIDVSITAMLDAYEGYPHLYNRCQTETAHGVHAWVYTYNGSMLPDNLIDGGDWKKRIVCNTNLLRAVG